MSHRRRRLSAVFLVICAVLGAGLAACDNKKADTGSTRGMGQSRETEATVLAGLDQKQDQAQCRTILQQLDNLDQSVSARREMADTERDEIVTVVGLLPKEAAELAQRTFSQTDAAYLEECLLVRAGVRSLNIESKPPLERAALGFHWACRMVYVDDRVPWPGPVWYTLQTGSGIPLSRAYVILAVWRQLGLDGCLVGPPALASDRSYVSNPSNPAGKPTYPPVRACGVKVGKDVYLFDQASGQAVPGTDGKPLTLAQAAAKPDSVKALAGGDEAKSWQVFLAPPLSGLSPRMEWLEKLNPAGTGVKLYADIRGERARWTGDVAGSGASVWNPDRDFHTATRVLVRYAGEESGTTTAIPVRDAHRIAMIPLERIPKTNLDGEAITHLRMAFLQHFDSLRYSADSPGDAMLRGHFSDALPALDNVKRSFENARDRMKTDRNLLMDFAQWAQAIESLLAAVNRAKLQNPAEVPVAMKNLELFRNQPRNRDIERAFIMGTAAGPVGAEVAYLTAQCAHERAERAQLEPSPNTPKLWQNAADWWERFLNASNEANSPFPARETHAKALLARTLQFTKK